MKTSLDYEVRIYAPHGFIFSIVNEVEFADAVTEAGYEVATAYEGIAEFVNENATRDGNHYIVPNIVPAYLGQDHFVNIYFREVAVDDFGNVEMIYEFKGLE